MIRLLPFPTPHRVKVGELISGDTFVNPMVNSGIVYMVLDLGEVWHQGSDKVPVVQILNGKVSLIHFGTEVEAVDVVDGVIQRRFNYCGKEGKDE